MRKSNSSPLFWGILWVMTVSFQAQFSAWGNEAEGLIFSQAIYPEEHSVLANESPGNSVQTMERFQEGNPEEILETDLSLPETEGNTREIQSGVLGVDSTVEKQVSPEDTFLSSVYGESENSSREAEVSILTRAEGSGSAGNQILIEDPFTLPESLSENREAPLNAMTDQSPEKVLERSRDAFQEDSGKGLTAAEDFQKKNENALKKSMNRTMNVSELKYRQNRKIVVAEAESEASAMETLKATVPPKVDREELRRELEKHSEILQAQAKVVKLAAKIIEPSVVQIKADMLKRGARGEQIKFHDEGSGIIVDRNGKFYVLTNHHVIRESLAEQIEIKLHDGRRTNPVHTWFDEETDIAVLEMKETDLIPAAIGDSNLMEIGDFVLAFGSPFGLQSSVTFGIISAKGRRAINLAANVNLQDFIQTDAAINPGNSGGPLVNLQAEVIAMNTAIASSSGTNAGIAFSIPIRMVTLIADQLIRYGKARRAYLGVTLDSHFSLHDAKNLGLPHSYGARVLDVQPDSPAAKANFTEGDVILKFNGSTVEDDKHLYNLVNLAEIGKEIPVTVYRSGKVYKINIFLTER